MAKAPLLIFGARYDALKRAIVDLAGGYPTAMVEGVTYAAADLPKLYALAERWDVKAAIEAVQQNQSYSLNGVIVTRAMLKDLIARDQEFTARSAAANRSGIGISYARPG